MDSILKEWKEWKLELTEEIKESKRNTQTDKKILELMLNILENSRIKVQSTNR